MNSSALAPLKRTQMAERGAVFELSAITGVSRDIIQMCP